MSHFLTWDTAPGTRAHGSPSRFKEGGASRESNIFIVITDEALDLHVVINVPALLLALTIFIGALVKFSHTRNCIGRRPKEAEWKIISKRQLTKKF
jgi:hypothetical protein